jgi:hypothetical protein
MRTSKSSSLFIWLIAGDLITLALVTVFGFSTHQELGTAGLRMLTTYLPLLAGWLLVAPFLGLFQLDTIFEARQLWRPFYAMLLAAPMAAFLRGAWLARPVLPVFVVILGGVSALAILAWRIIFWWLAARNKIRS